MTLQLLEIKSLLKIYKEVFTSYLTDRERKSALEMGVEQKPELEITDILELHSRAKSACRLFKVNSLEDPAKFYFTLE